MLVYSIYHVTKIVQTGAGWCTITLGIVSHLCFSSLNWAVMPEKPKIIIQKVKMQLIIVNQLAGSRNFTQASFEPVLQALETNLASSSLRIPGVVWSLS